MPPNCHLDLSWLCSPLISIEAKYENNISEAWFLLGFRLVGQSIPQLQSYERRNQHVYALSLNARAFYVGHRPDTEWLFVGLMVGETATSFVSPL